MTLLKWQEEAMTKKRVAVIGPRQSGKTYGAIQWARHAGKEVLYIVPSAQMIPYIVQAFFVLFPDGAQFVRPHHGLISWDDGTSIIVVSGENEKYLRGFRTNAVVIDDADYIKEDAFLSAILCCPSHTVFVGCTNPNRGGAKLLARFDKIEQMIVSGQQGKNSSYRYLLETAY